ncbi:unnamed protein product [Pleuronectes platessa]|uniref:Uncharacterized protein n=1 Tax=Pleuronectes platessa TaxID=8262 RepID=A0A9N7YVV3_PLEPL|nr:unnamed protein product [Pleuronectes platessa]
MKTGAREREREEEEEEEEGEPGEGASVSAVSGRRAACTPVALPVALRYQTPQEPAARIPIRRTRSLAASRLTHTLHPHHTQGERKREGEGEDERKRERLRKEEGGMIE